MVKTFNVKFSNIQPSDYICLKRSTKSCIRFIFVPRSKKKNDFLPFPDIKTKESVKNRGSYTVVIQISYH